LAGFRRHAITVALGRGFAVRYAKAGRRCCICVLGGLLADDASE